MRKIALFQQADHFVQHCIVTEKDWSAEKKSRSRAPTVYVYMDCGAAVHQKQPRQWRESVPMPYYSLWSGAGSMEGVRNVSVTEAKADESPAQSNWKRRHMTQLITAHHPGQDRIHVALSFMYI